MVQVEVDVVDGVPGGLRAQVTLELYQGDLLEYIRLKRHGGQLLCISTLICINGALKRVMGFWTLTVKIWKLEIFCYEANSVNFSMAR